jgi:outer membrane protein insertion porin family
LLNWPNFTGAGQKFRVRLQYGTSRKDFVLSLTEPFFLDRRLSLGGQVFYNEADYLSDAYNQRNYGFSLETRKPIGSFAAVSLVYLLQRTELFDIAAGASTALLATSGAATKSQLTPGIVFDTRDNPFLSRRGTRASFAPYIAGGFLGGDTQIYGFNLEAAHFIHLWKDTILQFQGQIAGVDTWGDGLIVPIYDKLFLGGSNDLRGFDFRDVSPRDINGEPLGGKSLARFTVEYTVPIIEKARAAVFYDTGFVNFESWNYNTNHLVSDIGIGLRLDLPIGPIRIDYAIPLQKDVYGGNGKFNFNVGYQF